MQGRGTQAASSSPSIFCTVLTSKKRAPAMYAAMMFCASWLLGPAAGPKGVSMRSPKMDRLLPVA